ncbi:MAG: glycosyltransferase family 2 protein [Oscillospiraceae bacterium]|nr:glycosyltransferase family 2 protein [Oscillospiraceae bacterium]
MISILMASYNGASYIAAQIESVLGQTCRDFTLYICDDCSDDGTWEIVQSYAQSHPGQVVALQNRQNSGSAKHNFFQMMLAYRDDYVMLCDQDDVWLPEKVEVTLAAMQKAEAAHHCETPILVHTDLTVVDGALHVLDRSYRHAVNGNWQRTALHYELAQNTVTGCTVMYNRALGDLIREEPSFFVMHDWWLALAASALGRIVLLDRATMLYRQHGDNSVGAKFVRSPRYLLRRLLDVEGYQKELAETFLQSESFYNMFRDRLSSGQQKLTVGYGRLSETGWLGRRLFQLRNRTVKYGATKKIAGFLFG